MLSVPKALAALLATEDHYLRHHPALAYLYSPSPLLGLERAFGLVILFTVVSTSITPTSAITHLTAARGFRAKVGRPYI